jgi:3-dehydroquinate dehydratase II
VPSRVLLLHGPNLNLLLDLPSLDAELEEQAERLGVDLHVFQANSEGALVDAVHAERTRVSGIIVNAARLAPTAEVLAEAISLVKRPAVEVVLDAGAKSRSALKGVVLKQLTGKDAYGAALDAIASEVRSQQGRPTGTMLPAATVSDDENTGRIDQNAVKKTLGRKTAPDRGAGGSGVKKSIGRSDGTAKIAASDVGLSRAVVKAKISERLSGKLSPAGLATWARSQWQQIQRGAPVESGQREKLEDVLQTLLLGASTKANDHQLIELMTQL